jgi:hypothetical protein
MLAHGTGAHRVLGLMGAHGTGADRFLRLVWAHGTRADRPLGLMQAHRARADGAAGEVTMRTGAVWRRAARTRAGGMRAVGVARAGNRCGDRRMGAIWSAAAVRELGVHDGRAVRVVVAGAGAAGDDGLDGEGPGDGGETGLQGGAGARRDGGDGGADGGPVDDAGAFC